MPPKVKITKAEILRTAVTLVREHGESALNARAIASALNCSTQPIFSNFTAMEELKTAVIEEAEILFDEYIKKEVEANLYPVYKASGMAYIRFAKEEKNLFRLLYMRDRSGEISPEDTSLGMRMEAVIQKNTGLCGIEVRIFQVEMWAVVHGIATMFATGYLELDWEFVSKMLTDTYLGLKKQYGLE